MAEPEPESIGDIHNYLEHFNPKEVGGVVISKTEVLDTPVVSSVSLGSADATGTGQYFVDQTTGTWKEITMKSRQFTLHLIITSQL